MAENTNPSMIDTYHRDYGIEQLLLIKQHLMAYSLTKDSEVLHQARLSFKRFNAWLSYLKLAGAESKTLQLDIKPIRKLFRNLGLARDCYIQIELCDQYQSLASQKLKSELSNLYSKQVRKSLSSYKDDDKLMRKIKRVNEKISRIDTSQVLLPFEEVMGRKIGSIVSLFAEANTDLELHKLRRRLKEAWYFCEIIQRGEIDCEACKDLSAHFRNLEQLLGAWHDAANLLISCARMMTQVKQEEIPEFQGLLGDVKALKLSLKSKFKVDFLQLLPQFERHRI